MGADPVVESIKDDNDYWNRRGVADMIIKGKFAHYTGEAVNREEVEVSSIRGKP